MFRSKIIAESMCKNKKVMGLVLKLSPLDLMKGLIADMGLLPKEAAKVVMDLRKKKISEISEAITPEPLNRRHFPPDPRGEVGDWPYDAMTTTGMATKNKQRKRSMTDDKNPEKRIKKYVFTDKISDADLERGTPGAKVKSTNISQPSAYGTHQKSGDGSDGNQSASGTSYDGKGRPGWSGSPAGKEFEIPPKSIFTKDRKRIQDATITAKVDNAGDGDEEESQIFKTANVGQNIPHIGYGGSIPGRKMGSRRR